MSEFLQVCIKAVRGIIEEDMQEEIKKQIQLSFIFLSLKLMKWKIFNEADLLNPRLEVHSNRAAQRVIKKQGGRRASFIQTQSQYYFWKTESW